MADPLCRWRYALPQTIMSLVQILPKQVVHKDVFWEEVRNKTKDGTPFSFETFQKTAYQLAVQVGLYYIDEDEMFHPRFAHDIDEEEARRYLIVVAKSYTAPNPYTGSMTGKTKAINIFDELLSFAKQNSSVEIDVKSVMQSSFKVPIGNADAITALMGNTPEFTKKGTTTLEYVPVDGVTSPKAFFDSFLWGGEKSNQNTQEEMALENIDRLSVALKMFAEKRKDDGEGGWLKSGCEVNGRIREYFDPLTVTALQAFDDAKIEELFCGKKGADGKVELETMWSGKNGQGWSHVKPANGADTKEIVDFLVKLKTDVGIAAKFLQGGFTRPKGFGPSVITELLMKFHPESCIKHGERSHNALRWLGLIDFEWNSAYTEDEYRQVCGAAAKILGRMAAMKLPRQINADGTEDTTKPDYLTVNEFLYFVDTNLKEIKEKIMSKAMKKPTTKKITTGKASISKLLANKEDSLMTMLVAGLLTKPLAILAGVSGTGKSRMVRHLAYKTCLDEDLKPSGESAPGNFKMVQVKPSWHDSADLLGYRSAVNEKHEYVSTDFVKFVLKAHAYPNTPFFVCLDEMNLAPVEHYFAEFLSACESIRKSDVTHEWTSDPIVAATDFDNNVLNLGGDVLFESADAALDAALKKTKARIEKEGLFIPRNLFVVGTVNMDDSTGGFSRKVLDRAMTIVMNEVHFEDLQKEDKDLTLSDDNLFTTPEIAKFIERKDFNKDMMSDDFRNQLEDIRQKLAKTPFALAYRFARETCMYKNALKETLDAKEVVKDSEGNPKKDASGADINADRACGDIALDHMILMKLLPRLTGTTQKRKNVIDDINAFLNTLVKEKRLSKETLKDMVERAGDNGNYLSFWP